MNIWFSTIRLLSQINLEFLNKMRVVSFGSPLHEFLCISKGYPGKWKYLPKVCASIFICKLIFIKNVFNIIYSRVIHFNVGDENTRGKFLILRCLELFSLELLELVRKISSFEMNRIQSLIGTFVIIEWNLNGNYSWHGKYIQFKFFLIYGSFRIVLCLLYRI